MKKRTFTSILFLLISIILFSCSFKEDTADNEDNSVNETEKAQYHVISATEAKKMMDEKDDYLIIDVRTEEEYAEGHITGAINIPNEVIKDQADEKLADKNQLLLIYCRSGRRSKEAAFKLLDLGYSNVYDFGGIIDWTYGTES
ncbi:MAG: rhodanese-like domain-containing protein [Erysipelotrichaceae bacterium]|nr:rhodanese-like domain-containing protein [Erysipelotrichaceae bacterium]